MNCGGGVGGFIASRDEERYVRQYNGFLVSITGTTRARRIRLLASPARIRPPTACARRAGTGPATRSISGPSPMRSTCRCSGPQGFREVGELILQQAHYAARALGRIKGVQILFPQGFFKEFVVNFDGTGKTVARINKALARRGIFGGKDLSRRIPRARPERALLRDRDPDEGGYRPAGGRAEGGDRQMSGENRLRNYHAARWDEPVVMELGHPGRRGQIFPAADPAVPQGRRRGGQARFPPACARSDAAEAARALGARGAAPLSASLAGDAGHDGHQPLRHLHDEIQCPRSARPSRSGPSSPRCIPTSRKRRCRASSRSSIPSI